MPRSAPILLSACLALFACKGDKSGEGAPGSGPEKDARLVTDVFSWECIEYSDAGEEIYQGVYAQVVRLQFAPDALPVVPLPSTGGCTAGLTMFPENAGADGADIPGADPDIEWETDGDDGILDAEGPGFWRDDVFADNRTCNDINDVLLGGTRLVGAGVLDGVGTPNPEDIPTVDFTGLTLDEGTGAETIQFGDEVTATWGDHDWDRVWVQVRREFEGTTWESVTCNATGLNEFTLDEAAWGQLDPTSPVDQNQLYVGFERIQEVETEDGYKVETAIRAMAVAIVQQ